MSRYRNWWRPNIERALREYPALKEKKANMQQAALTANYNPQPKGNTPARTTENLATATLSPREEQDYDAITRAIESVGRYRDGALVLRLVKLIYFKRTHTLTGAATATHISEATAKRKVGIFIAAVARNMGYGEN